MADTSERRWGWAAAAGVIAAVLAVWMDLSPLHAHHTADSFIPVLSGLYLWEPFFWKQNRFGSLIPLLSLGIDAPFANLLFQVGLRLFAVAASFFLLARTVVPRLYWPAVGALTLALWIGAKDLKAHAFVQMQPYGPAVALSLAGVALLEGKGRWRTLAGLALLGLGFWVSATTLFWLFPLVWLRGALQDRSVVPQGRTRLVLASLGAAFGVSMALSWSWKYKATAFGAARPEVWPRAWGTLLSRSVDYLSVPLILAGLGLLVFLAARRSRPAVAAGLCLLAMALADLGAMGLTHWAQVNSWSLRYVSEALLALGMLAPALLFILLLEGRPARWQRMANVLMLALLLPVVALRYGEPSVARARASLDVFGGATDELLASGATHLLGGYWRVWPAVFHGNMVRWERGERTPIWPPIWAITVRSAPTEPLWRPEDWGEARIAVLKGNERAAEDIRRLASLPTLYLAEDRGDVRIYTSTSTGGPILASRSAP